MAQIQRKYDFQPGTKVFSSQVDEEFNNLVDANNTLDEDVQGHKGKQADPTSSDPTKDKHVSDAQAKKWNDHADSKSNPHETTAADVGAYSKQEVDTNHYKKTVVDSKLAQKTDKTGDHEGTWRGLTPGETGEAINGGRIDYLYKNIFPRIFRDGVFPSVQNELAVTETNPLSMSIDVDTGQAWVEGYWYENAAIKEMNISAADVNNPRIDRIVIRLDIDGQNITAEVLQGTPAVAPVAPALTRNDHMYELSLAQVYVGSGVTSIVNADITDERWTTSLCGEAIPYQLQERADQAEADANAYTNSKVYLYGTDSISNGDLADSTKYNPKPAVSVMNVGTPGGGFPATYGLLTTYWSTDSRAYQTFSNVDADLWFRETHPSIYPEWSAWRRVITDAGGTLIGNLKVSANDGKYLLTDILTGGMATEVDGQIVEFGANFNQTGERDETKDGGMVRIDLRGEPYPLFSIIKHLAGGTTATVPLELKGNGIFNLPSQSFMRAWRSRFDPGRPQDNMQSINPGVVTKVSFSHVSQSQNEFDADSFRAKEPGYYQVSAMIRWSNDGDGELRLYTDEIDLLSKGAADVHSGTSIIHLDADQACSIYVFYEGASTTSISDAFFQVHKLS